MGRWLLAVHDRPVITPIRAGVSDDLQEILAFAVKEAIAEGAAIATLVEIRGGAARSLGSHLAIAASGQTGEVEAVARIAGAAGHDVSTIKGSSCFENIDRFSAVTLLHHDLDAEEEILLASLKSSAFYIGALGSTRTQKRRHDRLKRLGIDDEALNRIKAPIGLFGPTRDASLLAISVLADVSAARLAAYP
ncbi:XdhC family protein [Rhizobium sp. ARZ01]|uniref:XdhC family protein n=1 Tax=Rhizobium sp. ARZ01 TaxID=2769313 RepID=UPI00177F2CD3|nr:XdhC family protein [Rhizobium sp. ARZ01]MBD9371022.1 XdhC family protein [Rhizobium sp. ARZ01]